MNYRILIISLLLVSSLFGCETSAGLDDDAIKIENGRDSESEMVHPENISFNIKELTYDGLHNVPYLDWGIDYNILDGTTFYYISANDLKLSLNNYHIKQDLFVFAQRPDSVHSIKLSITNIPIDLSNPNLENGVELDISNLEYNIEILIQDSDGKSLKLNNDDMKISIASQIRSNSDIIKLFIKAELLNSSSFTSGIQLQLNVLINY